MVRLLTLAVLVAWLSSLTFAEARRGYLAAEVTQYRSGTEQIQYYLLEENGSRFEIEANASLIKRLGRLKGRAIELSLANQTTKGKQIAVRVRPLSRALPLVGSVRGVHQLVPVLVSFNGMLPAVGEDVLRQWAQPAPAGAKPNVQNLFETSSRALLTLELNQQSIVGPIAIQVLPGETCEEKYRVWGQRALQKVAKLHLKKNSHLSFIFPEGSSFGCSISGRGELFGNISWIFSSAASSFAHEIGHNVGFFHAGRQDGKSGDREYGDLSSPMGKFNPTGVMFNAANVVQRGWLSGSLQKLRAVEKSAQELYELLALENPADSLKVVTFSPGRNIAPYVVSFRQPALLDTGDIPPQFSQGASIHRDYGLGQSTDLVGVLRDGESFFDTRYGFSLTQISHTPVSVRVLIQRTPSKLGVRGACYFVDPCRILDRSPQLRRCDGGTLPYSVSLGASSEFCPVG